MKYVNGVCNYCKATEKHSTADKMDVQALVMSHGELAMNWLMGWSKTTTVRRTRDDAS